MRVYPANHTTILVATQSGYATVMKLLIDKSKLHLNIKNRSTKNEIKSLFCIPDHFVSDFTNTLIENAYTYLHNYIRTKLKPPLMKSHTKLNLFDEGNVQIKIICFDQAERSFFPGNLEQ